jgi:hypothetical protein
MKGLGWGRHISNRTVSAWATLRGDMGQNLALRLLLWLRGSVLDASVQPLRWGCISDPAIGLH